MQRQVVSGLRAFVSGVGARRNFGLAAPAFQKATDPIQQLFIDKIREYKQKSAGGKLVDPSPDIEREWKSELEKLAKIYGGDTGVDMTQFPSLKYVDPVIDPIYEEAK